MPGGSTGRVPPCVREVLEREERERRGVRRADGRCGEGVVCEGLDAGDGWRSDYPSPSEDAAPPGAPYAAEKFDLGQNKKRKDKMKTEYIFPSVLIALDVAASIPYAVKCNWRMMVYWLAAATLTACVTYTGGKA